jgi:hypothetical protein
LKKKRAAQEWHCAQSECARPRSEKSGRKCLNVPSHPVIMMAIICTGQREIECDVHTVHRFGLKRSQGEHNGLCSCLYITTRLEFRRTGSDRSDSYIRKKEKKTGPLIELALYFKKKWTGTSFFFSFFFQWLIYI